MNTILKRTICIILTVLVAIGGLWYMDGVLKLKRVDGILTMQDFYAQPEGSVDILMVGNSHAGCNIDTATLWRDYGIASYNLWGGVQPLWNSYHFILEALKYQEPQLIILEITPTVSDYEYSEQQNQIKNIVGMRPSLNKWEAVKVSAEKDDWFNLMLGFPMYHNRFDDLEMEDFSNFPWSDGLENFKGSYLLYGVGNYEFESAEGVTECREIMYKQEEYLRKCIELCQERGIDILLLKTPALERTREQEIYNSVGLIAEEYAVPFINMNLMDEEVGITAQDWSRDRHMNGSGARKVAAWLGEYLSENYQLPDRRGETGFESWDINAAVIDNDYIAAIEDASDYFVELSRGSKEVLIIKNQPSEKNDSYSAFVEKLSMLCDSPELLEGSHNTVLSGLPSSQIEGDVHSYELGGHQLTVNFEYQDVSFNGKQVLWFGSSDFAVVVYDAVTDSIIDSAVFTLSNGYALQRA